MKNTRLGGIFLAALVLASGACAGVSVALTGIGSPGTVDAAPVDNVFASTERTTNLAGEPVNQALGWRNDPSVSPAMRDVSQSFTTGSSAVVFDKITFKVGGGAIPDALKDNAEATFKLVIYKMPSASALPGDSQKQPVSEQTGSFAGFAADKATGSGNIIGTQSNYITFDFDNVSLSANTCYSVVLSFTASGSGFNIALAHNGNDNTFADGAGSISTDGTTWSASSDFYFYAQGTSSIPEPASIALLVGGIAGVAVFVRKRRRTTDA
ncbi:MAG: PEP-CTERM sorting domain-containing protein [Opitutaceae bacterium]|jgi:hypothetical protein|nr:PEP-CTERM sorting domain-containing protein [Opitutaceae bacterium]